MVLSKKKLKKIRAALLEITPEITAILDDIINVNNMRGKAGELSPDEAAGRGITIIKEFIELLLVRQYDAILRVLAALFETSPSELEDLEFGVIVAMVDETLADEMLFRFFPRLRLLAPKTQSAT